MLLISNLFIKCIINQNLIPIKAPHIFKIINLINLLNSLKLLILEIVIIKTVMELGGETNLINQVKPQFKTSHKHLTLITIMKKHKIVVRSLKEWDGEDKTHNNKTVQMEM